MTPDPVPTWQLAHHARVDPHGSGSSISDVILGAQDGIVNVLGVMLGVAGAGGSRRIALAAALAAAFAESLSMAAVAYTSSVAANDVFRAERERERRHIQLLPALERQEVRELYERKGFEGELLDRVVTTITADPEVWVAVMMSEEHRLVPVARGRSLRSAFVVLVASLVGSLIPALPFMVLDVRPAVWGATAVSAAALFAIGVYKARTTVGRPLLAGAEIAAIGMASAVVGWFVGTLFGT